MSNSIAEDDDLFQHESEFLPDKLNKAMTLPFSEMLDAVGALVHRGAIGDISIDVPDWLIDGTNFHSSIWSCYFGETDGYSIKKLVNFDVQLASGTSLIDPKNSETLKWFKVFLVVLIHERFNGGARKKPAYELLKFNRGLHTIDFILLNDREHFDIGANGLGMVSVNSIRSFLLQNTATPVSDYLYDYPSRLTAWFKSKLDEVSHHDTIEAIRKFPLIENLISAEDRVLDFDDAELIKVRTIIALNGWYDLYPGGKRFNPRVFITTEYRNTLHGVALMPRVIPELNLEDSLAREFAGVPVTAEPAPGVTLGHLRSYVSIVKKIPIVEACYGIKGIPIRGFEKISAEHLFELANKKYVGRFVTIPYPVLLHMLGNSFQYFIDNRHVILDAVLALMVAVDKHHFASSPKMRQIEELFSKIILPDKLKVMGVNRWCPDLHGVIEDDFYQAIRSNKYLLYCYQVLIGTFLVVIGSLAARRQSEIIELHPTKCLEPAVNPYLSANASLNYCLTYAARKTGSRTHHRTLSVGITLPMAKFIWDLMEFRRNCEVHGVVSAKTHLLLWIDQRKVRATPIKIWSYNQALDIVCDYFESRKVTIDRVQRRYYLRQHQLRRFIALAFYHSSGGNIEALRHLLGHADVEHVYIYISESMPGAILDTAKAEVIVDFLFDGEDSIEGLDWLKQKIIEKYSSDDFVARSLLEIQKSYEPLIRKGVRVSSVSLSDLVDHQTCLNEVMMMLGSHAIDLTPDFFVVTTEDGTQENRFNLVLKIAEATDAR